MGIIYRRVVCQGARRGFSRGILDVFSLRYGLLSLKFIFGLLFLMHAVIFVINNVVILHPMLVICLVIEEF